MACMSEPRGAGMGGGLLFTAIVLVLGYLVITSVLGVVKWILGAAFIVVVIALALSVLKRR